MKKFLYFLVLCIIGFEVSQLYSDGRLEEILERYIPKYKSFWDDELEAMEERID